MQLNEEAVDAYAEEMSHRGIEAFPPVDVFLDDEGTHWLGDGFHRVTAAQRNGLTEIKAKVYHGSRADALVYNVSANHKNEVVRTKADKRHSVMLLLAEPDYYVKSDRAIAELCYVGNQLVGDVRRDFDAARNLQLCESHSSPPPAKRIGRDGKVRSVVTAKGKLQEERPQEAAEEPAQEVVVASPVATGAADALLDIDESHPPNLFTRRRLPEQILAVDPAVEPNEAEPNTELHQAVASSAEPVESHEDAPTDGPVNLAIIRQGWDEGFLAHERVEERLACADKVAPSDRYNEVDRELFCRLFTEMARTINRVTVGASVSPSTCQKIAAETALAVGTFIRSGPTVS